MKKAIILLSVIFLLSGCSGEGLPFFSNNDNRDNQEKTADKDPVEQIPEKQTSGGEQQDGGNPANEEDSSDEAESGKLTLETSFFNEIQTVDGRNIIQNPDNSMVLVNKEFALPDGHAPSDLVRPNVAFSFGDQDIEKSYLRVEAAEALETMFAAAKQEGIYLFAVSGYRSFERQTEIYSAEVAQKGKEKAEEVVAVPGNSEHQTGLAMDISSESAGFGLSEAFGETPEGKWLRDNAHRFGFILRYPKDKVDITKYSYEPWHFRYVGVKAATEIFENNLSLEEFFEIVEKI
ncbi:M15 family metallopeptidase [Bacillaceae bacterium Marseille-Q3522]|nr:M15 family metallopeptidase [Bacillaceae bacterium Marseille-Q3522]